MDAEHIWEMAMLFGMLLVVISLVCIAILPGRATKTLKLDIGGIVVFKLLVAGSVWGLLCVY